MFSPPYSKYVHTIPRPHSFSWLGDEMLHVLMLKVSAAMVPRAALEVMGAKADCTQVDPIWAHVVLHVW